MFDYLLLHWAAFFTAAFLLTLSPGPDIAFIFGQTVKGGRKSGFAAMFGIWGGTIGHVILAVVGLSAILSASATAFAMVKWVGVAYLVWLGLVALRSRGGSFISETVQVDTSSSRIFWQGALIALLNPKVAIFFLAFLPQFVVPDAGPTWAQVCLHGFLLICVSAFVEPPLVLVGVRLTARLRNNPRLGQWIDRSVGVLFIALGMRLALETR
jgi:threonine/homoserine/homoserine lactone efflux protein